MFVANLGRFLPKEQSSLLGLGAGLLTWQGLATLMTSFGQSKSIGKLPAMAFCMLGAVGVVLVKFVTQLQSKGKSLFSFHSLTRCHRSLEENYGILM